MKYGQRTISRKLRILYYAIEIGSVVKTCRYYGIGCASFYSWRTTYQQHGESGLIDKQPIPKWHANRTAPEIEERWFLSTRNITSARSVLRGTWRAITRLRYLILAFIVFYTQRIESTSTGHKNEQSAYQAL